MSVVSMGEILIDFVAMESGVSVGDAERFNKTPGGAPANVAVAVKRLGHPSAFIGQVGDDPFGYFLAGVLEKEGIDLRGLRFTREARTPLAFVSLDAENKPSFSFYRNPSADMLMRPEDVALDVIDEYEVFHFGSISMIAEPSKSATLTALQHAREKQKIISYDPNLRLSLWPDADTARTVMLEGFEYANIVKISEEELEFLTGGTLVEALWRDATRLIVVTHGAQGSSAYNGRHSIHMPGQGVKTVDTTGAGDAFMAGVLHSVLARPRRSRLSFKRIDAVAPILHFANSVGALATTKRGGIQGMPTRRRVQNLARTAG